MRERVLVAMSGGVDSSVAALLLMKQGYEVAGATFELFDGCNENNVSDAADVCKKLGIPHYVLDYRRIFTKYVTDYFVKGYAKGETPNPCIACNRNIKFGAFVNDASHLGFDHISTGHYAGVSYDDKLRRWLLCQSVKPRKDQSYVLYHLSQYQLAMLILPLEQYEKSEIREMASNAGLSVESKSDSQDICFVPDGDYVSFIERYTGTEPEPGNYLDDDGNVVGKHKGVLHYTIGQRKGLGISFGRHMFVSRLDPINNTVTLSDESAIFTDTLEALDLNLIKLDKLIEPLRVMAKIRYSQTPAPATIYPLDIDSVRVVFDEPQRAVTSGQAVVFYDGKYVVGGACIR